MSVLLYTCSLYQLLLYINFFHFIYSYHKSTLLKKNNYVVGITYVQSVLCVFSTNENKFWKSMIRTLASTPFSVLSTLLKVHANSLLCWRQNKYLWLITEINSLQDTHVCLSLSSNSQHYKLFCSLLQHPSLLEMIYVEHLHHAWHIINT